MSRVILTICLLMLLSGQAYCASASNFERLYGQYEDMDTSIEAPRSEPVTIKGSLSPVEQLDRDYQLLQTADKGMEVSLDRISFLYDECKDSPLFSPDLEVELVNEWAAFLRYRKVLLKIAASYMVEPPVKRALTFGPTVDQKKVILGYASSLFLFSSAVRLTNLLESPSDKCWKRMDEPNEELNIPAGEISSLWRVITSLPAIRKLAEAKNAYFAAYPEASELSDAGILPAHWLHHRIHTDIEYISQEGPSIWRDKIRQLWQTITQGVHKPYYSIFSAISIWVGDTKYFPRKPAVTASDMKKMISMLEPGDILLERENWYLSNAFLPGFWPHGIVYTGTAEQLRELGLDKDPRVARHIAEFSQPDHVGHAFRLVEAISEGVVMNTIEHATDADYICAFRPQISPEQKKEAIARAFAYIGSPYDFDFNFNSADKLVCTELVYRCYGDFVSFDVDEVAGKPVVQGSGIINKFARELVSADAQLDFIFFLDCNRKTRETWFSTKMELIKSNSRNGLAFLNEH